MELGDFTKLAKAYQYRTGYSETVLKVLANHIGAYREGFKIADVGAGTGKLTEQFIEMGFTGYAVEPNDAMREEGARLCGTDKFLWSKGQAENTGLPDSSVDWVIMASSFHWTENVKALEEFFRILKSGGFVTVMWNPRDIENSEFESRVQKIIDQKAPNIKRVSSGSKQFTADLHKRLLSTGNFGELFFLEGWHVVEMSKERYMGAWKSVNDIQTQAGEQKFKEILYSIEQEIKDLDDVVVPYITRAWTIQGEVI